jgi:antitoxin HicB
MAATVEPRKIPLVFFRNEAGAEPVRDWLKSMDPAERRAIGMDLLRAQWRWPAGMPLCRAMGRGMWEIRTDLPGNRTARVLICSFRGQASRAARVHQENASHPRGRFGAGAKTAKGVETVTRKNARSPKLGSSIDDFLKEEGIFEEAQALAVKEVVAWKLAQAMKKRKISKARMATLLKTSRSQVDRILDPKRDITLGSLQRAAALVGQRLVIELV